MVAISLSVDSDFKTGKTEDFYRPLFAIVAEEVSAIDGINNCRLFALVKLVLAGIKCPSILEVSWKPTSGRQIIANGARRI